MHSIKDQQHWDAVYSARTEDEMSWFQQYPKTSLDFIKLFNLPLNANIIDVGGGASHFVDSLLDAGYRNIYVLDISPQAIEKSKQRLGQRASKVHWIIADITNFVPPVQFDFWHDRAAFHFLTSADKIDKYVSIAENAVRRNGYLVLGTFSENGPRKCSGLDVRQYSEASMSAKFEAAFKRIKCVNEDHVTPANAIQNFLFCSFQKD